MCETEHLTWVEKADLHVWKERNLCPTLETEYLQWLLKWIHTTGLQELLFLFGFHFSTKSNTTRYGTTSYTDACYRNPAYHIFKHKTVVYNSYSGIPDNDFRVYAQLQEMFPTIASRVFPALLVFEALWRDM